MMTTEIQSVFAEAARIGTASKQNGLPRSPRENSDIMRLFRMEQIQKSKVNQIRLFLAFYQAYDN